MKARHLVFLQENVLLYIAFFLAGYSYSDFFKLSSQLYIAFVIMLAMVAVAMSMIPKVTVYKQYRKEYNEIYNSLEELRRTYDHGIGLIPDQVKEKDQEFLHRLSDIQRKMMIL